MHARTGGPPTAILLLSFVCAPVLASGIDALCDQSDGFQPDLTIPEDELTVEIVDHGVSRTTLPDGDVEIRDGNLPISLSITPRVDTILRRIFDESAPEADKDTAATPAAMQDAASIAELAAPTRLEGSSERGSERSLQPELDVLSPQLPGVSAEDTIRFRRQMYRTDI